jgi:hypothetical protein
MKRIVFVAIFVSLFHGCLPSDDYYIGWEGGRWQDGDHFLIFQSEFTNHAWGNQHFGWMMNQSGKVKRFQKSATWVFPDSLGYISVADMKKNLAQCDSVIAHVDPRIFDKYADKALTCSKGPFSPRKLTGVDIGQHTNAFYLFDPYRKRYKQIILDLTGDWSQENLAPKAKEVVNWMNQVK